MHSEITTGENPVFTSFVGASAPPNHVEAAIAQKTPSPCMDRITGTVLAVVKGMPGIMRWRSGSLGFTGRLGGDGLNSAEPRNESLRDPPIDCSLQRRDAANLRHAFKQCQAVLVFRVVPPTAAMSENTCVKPSRFVLLSCAEPFFLSWQRATRFQVRRRVTISSWCKSAGSK